MTCAQCWTVATLFATAAASAAPPPVVRQDLPRVPPTAAAEAAHTFRLHHGLRVELVASEPLISSPVGICFDEGGRLFVVEMRDYPDRRDERLGRITMLQDTRGDGRYDKATVFAEHLPWPTSCLWYGGGLFVTASPDVLFLKDTLGAGKADDRKVVFTGFGTTVDRLNVQGLVNGLTWGIDHRIHGATSFNGGVVTRPGTEEKPLDLHGRDFSFDPRTMQPRAENGGGQHGLGFDSFGRKFVCMNTEPVQTFLYDARYAARNPLYAMPAPLQNVAADGSDVFRVSPEEAWRVLRTRWRVSGLVNGPIEGGGRASGYFTGVSGITVYTGDALPAQFEENVFIGEVANNLVHREVIASDGVGVVAHRAADERNSEFLASTDVWFRPVQLANGPDGALYVIDMYREVIEHPWSLPDEIRQRLDLHSGTDRGRIWRVVPEGFVARKPPPLSTATTAELVALLEHPNGWHRDTAARLLYERQDASAAPLLARMLETSKSPVARFRALCALDGLEAISPSHLLTALHDADARVRERAVVLSEPLLRSGHCPPDIWAVLRGMTQDPDVRVRYQLAFTLGESREPDRVEALARIAQRDAAEPSMRAALLNSASGHEGDMFGLVVAVPEVRDREPGQELLRSLALLIGRRDVEGDVTRVVTAITVEQREKCLRLALILARGLREGMRASGINSFPQMDDLIQRARTVAADEAAANADRVEAVRLLGTTSFAEGGVSLLPLLASHSQALQLESLMALDQFSDDHVGPELIKQFASLSLRARGEALAVLLKRRDRALALLHGIESGAVRPADVPSTQANFLRKHGDPQVRTLATKLLPPLASRADVIREFEGAPQLEGNAAYGHSLYQQRCSSCHRLGGEGFAVGPDLVTVRNAGKQKMLVNVLDPNREVAPNYVAYLVETRSGESLAGIIAAETAASLTVRQAFGKETTVLRADVGRIASQGISLMPEGLEQGLKPQDLADLMEYVFTAPDHPK